MQVNSLGLTEAQPENNVPRIALEALGVTLSRDARCRALQLPAWNEALGLPRPWDQQWSLRIQQILAYETDLLEYPDIFEGSLVIEKKTAEIEAARLGRDRAHRRAGRRDRRGRDRLHEAGAGASRTRAACAAIESGEQVVVGVNRFREARAVAAAASGADSILSVDESAGREQIERLRAHRARATQGEVEAALRALRDALAAGANVMQASIRCAHAGVTTGEWADALRAVFGEYRAPTGVRRRPRRAPTRAQLEALRARVDAVERGSSAGASSWSASPASTATRAAPSRSRSSRATPGSRSSTRASGMTPDEIVRAALQEGVHLIGLSILSGSHLALAPEIARRARVPVIVGGIIPEADAAKLRAEGVAAVYTPRDYDVLRILREMVEIAAAAHGVA